MPLQTLPGGVMQDYYDRNQDRIRMPYEEFIDKAFNVWDAEDIEIISEQLHKNHYKHLNKDEYDEKSGLREWRDNRPSWTGNVVRGMGERAADLMGGLLELGNTALKTIGVPDETAEMLLGDMAEKLRNYENGYKQWTSWEDATNGDWRNLFWFAMEQGLISAPDMIAVMAGPIGMGTYIGARTGELAHERAQSDMRDNATGMDLLVALPTATVAALLERVGTSALVGATKKSKNAILKHVDVLRNQIPKSGLNEGILRAGASVGAATAKGALTEAATEAAQETIEYTGTTAGTERGFKGSEAVHSAIVGGTVGGIFGGVVRGGTASGQAIFNKTQAAAEAAGQEGAPEDEDPDRHQSSYDLEEEAKRGIRTAIDDPRAVKTGDLVMISPRDKEAGFGTADVNEDTGLITVRNNKGDVVGTYDMSNPEDKSSLYTLTDEEKSTWETPTGEEQTPEQEAQTKYNNEIARLVASATEKPSASRIEQLRKMMGDARWENLPDDQKELVEDLIDKADAAEAEPQTPTAPATPETEQPTTEPKEPKKPEEEKPVTPTAEQKEPEEETGEGEVESPEAPSTPSIDEPTEPVTPPSPPLEPAEYKPQVDKEGNPRTGTVYWKNEKEEVEAEYAIFDADSLIASHDIQGVANPNFPQVKQPRDRASKGSINRSYQRASNFKPIKVIEDAGAGQSGSPIVDIHGVVEAGNGRVIALKEVYKRAAEGNEKAAEIIKEYHKELSDRGYDIEGVKQPVLARIRRTEQDEKTNIEFIRDLNTSVQEENTEEVTAEQDAGLLTDEILQSYEGGEITSIQNQGFVNRIVNDVIPANDRVKVITDDGLTEHGRRRIELALIQKAYGDAELTKKFYTDQYKGAVTLRNILAELAPRWSAYTSAAQAAGAENWDISDIFGPLAKDIAVHLIAKQKGGSAKSLDEIIGQQSLIAEADPVRQAIGSMFVSQDAHTNLKIDSAARTTRKFKIFMTMAEARIAMARTGDMFSEDAGKESRETVIDFVREVGRYDHDHLLEVLKSAALVKGQLQFNVELNQEYSDMMMSALDISGIFDTAQRKYLGLLKEQLEAKPQAVPDGMPEELWDEMRAIKFPLDPTTGLFSFAGVEDIQSSVRHVDTVMTAVSRWEGNNTEAYELMSDRERGEIAEFLSKALDWILTGTYFIENPEQKPETPEAETPTTETPVLKLPDEELVRRAIKLGRAHKRYGNIIKTKGELSDKQQENFLALADEIKEFMPGFVEWRYDRENNHAVNLLTHGHYGKGAFGDVSHLISVWGNYVAQQQEEDPKEEHLDEEEGNDPADEDDTPLDDQNPEPPQTQTDDAVVGVAEIDPKKGVVEPTDEVKEAFEQIGQEARTLHSRYLDIYEEGLEFGMSDDLVSNKVELDRWGAGLIERYKQHSDAHGEKGFTVEQQASLDFIRQQVRDSAVSQPEAEATQDDTPATPETEQPTAPAQEETPEAEAEPTEPKPYDGDDTAWRPEDVNYDRTTDSIAFDLLNELSDHKEPQLAAVQAVVSELTKIGMIGKKVPEADKDLAQYVVDSLLASIVNMDLRDVLVDHVQKGLPLRPDALSSDQGSGLLQYRAGIYARLRMGRHYATNVLREEGTAFANSSKNLDPDSPSAYMGDADRKRAAILKIREHLTRLIMHPPRGLAMRRDKGQAAPEVFGGQGWGKFVLYKNFKKDELNPTYAWVNKTPRFKKFWDNADALIDRINATMENIDYYAGGQQGDKIPITEGVVNESPKSDKKPSSLLNPLAAGQPKGGLLPKNNIEGLKEDIEKAGKQIADIETKLDPRFWWQQVRGHPLSRLREFHKGAEMYQMKFETAPEELKKQIESLFERWDAVEKGGPPALALADIGKSDLWERDAVNYRKSVAEMTAEIVRSYKPDIHGDVPNSTIADIHKQVAEAVSDLLYPDINIPEGYENNFKAVMQYVHDTLLHTMNAYRRRNFQSKGAKLTSDLSLKYINAAGVHTSKEEYAKFLEDYAKEYGEIGQNPTEAAAQLVQLKLVTHYMTNALQEMADAQMEKHDAFLKAREHLTRVVGEVPQRKARKDNTFKNVTLKDSPEVFFTKGKKEEDWMLFDGYDYSSYNNFSVWEGRSADNQRKGRLTLVAKAHNKTLNNMDAYGKGFKAHTAAVDTKRPAGLLDEQRRQEIEDLIEDDGKKTDAANIAWVQESPFGEGGVFSARVELEQSPSEPEYTFDYADVKRIKEISNERLANVLWYIKLQAERAIKVNEDKLKDGRPLSKKNRKAKAIWMQYLKIANDEHLRRENTKPEDLLAERFKTGTDRKQVTRTNPETGVKESVWEYRIFNLVARNKHMYQHVEGMNQALRDRAADLARVGIEINMDNPFEGLGGRKEENIEDTDEGIRRAKDRSGYVFSENIFEKWDIVKALGLDVSEDLLGQAIADQLGSLERDTVDTFRSIDHAPIVAEQNVVSESSDTHSFISTGLDYAIEQEVIDNQLDDIGRIVQAFEDGHGAFVLGTPTGSGKTFMLGGAINELITKNPDLNILYVTKNQGLHEQLEKDLKPLLNKQLTQGKRAEKPTAGTVRLNTYDGLLRWINASRDIDKDYRTWVDDKTVIILDEGHRAMKIDKKTLQAFQELTTRSRFNILASATPFTNPATSQYLFYFGAFKKFPAVTREEKEREKAFGLIGYNQFHKFIRQFGVTINPGNEARQQRARDLTEYHPSGTPKAEWRIQNSQDRRENTINFLKAITEAGIYISRQDVLDPTNTINEFEDVEVGDRWLKLYDFIEQTIYPRARQWVRSVNGNPQTLASHEVNLHKRIAEGAKVDIAAEKIMQERFYPKKIVNWSGRGEKNPQHSNMMKYMLRMHDSGSNAFEWTDILWRKAHTKFRPENIEIGKDGKKYMRVKLITDEWVEVEIEERKSVAFIESKKERWLNTFAVSDEADPLDVWDPDGGSREDILKNWRDKKRYSVLEVIEYFNRFQQVESHWLDGQLVWKMSKFSAYQVGLAHAYKEAGAINGVKLESTKDSLKAKLIELGLPEEEITFYTGDETTQKGVAAENKARFNEGDANVIIMTMAAGGTGVSLHDTKGDSPRSIIGVIMPWEAVTMTQALGRISRLGMQSVARVKWIWVREMPIEVNVKDRLDDRLKDLNYSVTGRRATIEREMDLLGDNLGLEDRTDEEIYGDLLAELDGEARGEAAPTPEDNSVKTFVDEIVSQEGQQGLNNLSQDLNSIRGIWQNTAARHGVYTDHTGNRNKAVPQHIRQAMQKFAHQLSGGRVNISYKEYLQAITPAGDLKGTAGFYRPSTIDIENSMMTIARRLADGTETDMYDTLAHEHVHYFRRTGLLSDAEYAVLKNEVLEKKLLDKYKIKKLYADVSEDVQVEEAIAFMAAEYMSTKYKQRENKFSKPFVEFFERIALWFKLLGERLHVADVQAVDVLERMYHGEVGMRQKRGVIAGAPEEPGEDKGEREARQYDGQWDDLNTQRAIVGEYERDSGKYFHDHLGRKSDLNDAQKEEYARHIGEDVTVRLDVHRTKENLENGLYTGYAVKKTEVSEKGMQKNTSGMGETIGGEMANLPAVRIKLNKPQISAVNFTSKWREIDKVDSTQQRNVHAVLRGELIDTGDVPQIPYNNHPSRYMRLNYYFRETHEKENIGFYVEDLLDDNAKDEIITKQRERENFTALSKETTDMMKDGEVLLDRFIGTDAEIIFTSSGVWLDTLSGKIMTGDAKLEELLSGSAGLDNDPVAKKRVRYIGGEDTTYRQINEIYKGFQNLVALDEFKEHSPMLETLMSIDDFVKMVEEKSHGRTTTSAYRVRVDRDKLGTEAYEHNQNALARIGEILKKDDAFILSKTPEAAEMRRVLKLHIEEQQEFDNLKNLNSYQTDAPFFGDLGKEMLAAIHDSYRSIVETVNELKSTPNPMFVNFVPSDIHKLTYLTPIDAVRMVKRGIAKKGLTGIKEQKDYSNEMLYSVMESNAEVYDLIQGMKGDQSVEIKLINYTKSRLINDYNSFYQMAPDGNHIYTEFGIIRIKDHPYASGLGWTYAMATPDIEVVIDRTRLYDPDYFRQKKAEIDDKLEWLSNNPVPEDKLYFMPSGGNRTRPTRGVGRNFERSRARLRAQREENPEILESRHAAPEQPYVQADDPEVEERIQEAMRGIRRSGFLSRMKEYLTEEWHKSTRHHHLVDQGKVKGRYNAEFLQKARHLEAAREVAGSRIQNFFKRMTDGLTTRQYDLFTRAIVFENLIWSAEQGHKLPFGFETLEEVELELAKVNNAIEDLSEYSESENGGITEQNVIKDKIRLRRKELDDLRHQLAKSGVLPWSRLKNQNYFHHQVMEYAQLKKFGQGSGTKVSTPFWHARKGSHKDINMDYFQAEAAWMYKARTDIATANFINWLRKSKYNSAAEYKASARNSNNNFVYSVLINDIHTGLLGLRGKRGKNIEQKSTNLARNEFNPETHRRIPPVKLMREFKTALKATGLIYAYRKSQSFKAVKEYDKFRMQIARNMNTLKVLIAEMAEEDPERMKLLPWDIRAAFDNLLNKDIDPDEVDNFSEFMKVAAWFGQSNGNDFVEERKASLKMLKAIAHRRVFIKELLGNSYIDPGNRMQLIQEFGSPEDQALWQPDSYDGKTRAVHMYTAYTVPEHIFERSSDHIIEVFENLTGKKGVTPDEILGLLQFGDPLQIRVNARQMAELFRNMREQTVVGGLKEQMILPKYIADTLNELRDPYIEGVLGRFFVEMQARWKAWILFMPRRIFKYTLNNTTSDIDALLANPSATGTFKQIAPAFRELYGYIYKGEKPSEKLIEALNMGVINSSLIQQEIPDKAFRDLDYAPDMDPDFRVQVESGFSKYNPIKRYFTMATNVVRWRESGVRYAAYLHYRKKFVEEGKTPQEIGFGATPPWMIEGVTDKYDLAAMMARDALGDYGNLSERGRYLRQRVIPFWSWAESNLRRYTNLWANIGRYAATKDRVQARMAVVGSLTARMMAFYLAINIFNRLFFPDDEDRLDTTQSLQLHLNLGERQGKQTSLRFQGALSDYLGWLNMEDVGSVIGDVQDGRATFMDVFQEMAKGPFNKLAQGLNPMYKVPFELAAGKQFFPDVFKPFDIQDPWEHAARTFALHPEYKQIAQWGGYPVPYEGWINRETLYDVFVYRKDKADLEYNLVRRDAYKWKERHVDAKRKRRLFTAWRKAIRIGDTETASQIEQILVDEFGTKGRSFDISQFRTNPLGALTKKERREYLKTLTPEERRRVEEAMEKWRENQNIRRTGS